jgi:hypothetical protein
MLLRISFDLMLSKNFCLRKQENRFNKHELQATHLIEITSYVASAMCFV